MNILFFIKLNRLFVVDSPEKIYFPICMMILNEKIMNSQIDVYSFLYCPQYIAKDRNLLIKYFKRLNYCGSKMHSFLQSEYDLVLQKMENIAKEFMMSYPNVNSEISFFK